ncbi:hypothetical protein LBMAG48_10400 [Phycisphaerae bacterium]|jgi:uncharacterized protein (DUF433 family)|nr:hypothetical protein LBMAG48_10400 [Phycisphaerae bacterium]
MDYRQIVVIDPERRSGQPCVRGLRISVKDVLEYLASGMTTQEILEDFPELQQEDILACCSYAAAILAPSSLPPIEIMPSHLRQ